jgi:putative transposase
MGIEAICRKPSTSKSTPGHKIYPYLLRGMTIDRPNQVWAMDITYVPMARGFVYLAAVVDWYSRRVLAWRVSITLEAAFCVEALEEALARHGRPELFNTDQGSHFTGRDFTSVLLKAGFAISMDGKGAWRDNVFVERLWRSIKYEEVYLRAYETVSEARASICRYLAFYNGRRPHSSLDRQTTDRRRTRPTSPRCRNSRQPEPGRAPLIPAQAAVQTNEASSTTDTFPSSLITARATSSLGAGSEAGCRPQGDRSRAFPCLMRAFRRTSPSSLQPGGSVTARQASR